MTGPVLTECSILIVEDEYMIADELARELEHEGAQVLGPVPSIEAALALLDQGLRPDGAILDVNLGGDRVYPLADMLVTRGVPFVFMTGYDVATLPARFANVPTCEKPFRALRLIEVIRVAIPACHHAPLRQKDRDDNGLQAPRVN